MSKPLLHRSEPPAFRIRNARGKGQGIITVEHASNRLPKALQKNFGVAKKDMTAHIGWDIGIEVAALHLAKLLDMPVVLSSYSRLVVDLNRALDHPGLMPKTSDPLPGRGGIRIPGNEKLSKAARKARLDALYHPYHGAVKKLVRASLKKKRVPFLLSIHSFTPDMDAGPRPWHLGVLWNKEDALAKNFIRTFKKQNPKMKVGANQPYDLRGPRLKGAVSRQHGEGNRIPTLLVEFRQDLIAKPADGKKWAQILARALQPLLDDPATFQRRKNNSKSKR